MKKKIKKAVRVFLALVMVFSFLLVSVVVGDNYRVSVADDCCEPPVEEFNVLDALERFRALPGVSPNSIPYIAIECEECCGDLVRFFYEDFELAEIIPLEGELVQLESGIMAVVKDGVIMAKLFDCFEAFEAMLNAMDELMPFSITCAPFCPGGSINTAWHFAGHIMVRVGTTVDGGAIFQCASHSYSIFNSCSSCGAFEFVGSGTRAGCGGFRIDPPPTPRCLLCGNTWCPGKCILTR